MFQRLEAKEYRGQSVVYAHQKMDGHRLTVHKSSTGLIRALTTGEHDIAHRLKHFGWWLPIVDRLPCDTILDGELHIPGELPSCVKTAIITQDQRLRFSVFAIPKRDGVDIQKIGLVCVAEICQDYHLDFAPYEMFDPHTDYFIKARKLGIEGWVMKKANYVDWYKLKEVKTIDVFVIGFVDGKGKNIGLVGSLQVAVWWKRDSRSETEGYLDVIQQTDKPKYVWHRVHIANVGGMTDEVRVDIDEQSDLMRVCEIKYQAVNSKGRLRHPRFVRWRDDKLANKCIIGQDPQLEVIHAANNDNINTVST